MQLTVAQAAALLQVTEDAIYKFIDDDGLPASRYNDRYFLNPVKLMEWARHNQLSLTETNDSKLPQLHEALEAGGVFHGLGGATKIEVLKSIVERLRLPNDVDRELVFEMLRAREEAASTGFGDGIAIPHARSPLLLHAKRPAVSLCFLDHAVDFHALDGKPVFAIFTIVCATVAHHLHLLSRVANAIGDKVFIELIRRRAESDALIGRARELDLSPRSET
jgi:PTS system nitrogen regulatory IIA component